MPRKYLKSQLEIRAGEKEIYVYNMNGDLVSESEVDITGIQESCTIILSGDGDLESVTSTIN